MQMNDFLKAGSVLSEVKPVNFSLTIFSVFDLRVVASNTDQNRIEFGKTRVL